MINFSLYKEVKRLYQPKRKNCLNWVSHSLVKEYQLISIDLIIVSKKRSLELNKKYRQKDNPTNVISLEYHQTRESFNLLCGEIILCDEIIVEEAISQQKDIMAHYAHMIVHGTLHLQGFDHQNDDEANQMEAFEVKIMKQFGYPNPYLY